MKKIMIRNIVFDLGNVLVDFNPSRIVNAVFIDQKEQRLMLSEIFFSKGWKLVDKGLISIEEHQQDLISRFPQYAEEIDWILKNWHKDLPRIPGMKSLVQMLSKMEFGLYILSNAGYRYFEYALSKNKLFKYFNGFTISAELKLLKPQSEIYDQFCEIHNLKPEECLFIDDQLQNVQAAINAGWQAYQFKGTLDLISFFEDNLDMDFKGIVMKQKQK